MLEEHTGAEAEKAEESRGGRRGEGEGGFRPGMSQGTDKDKCSSVEEPVTGQVNVQVGVFPYSEYNERKLVDLWKHSIISK